jgi:uroporphyrinogen-III synthase
LLTPLGATRWCVARPHSYHSRAAQNRRSHARRDLGLSEEEAYRTLQRQSRQMRKSMKEVAEAVLISDSIKRNP